MKFFIGIQKLHIRLRHIMWAMWMWKYTVTRYSDSFYLSNSSLSSSHKLNVEHIAEKIYQKESHQIYTSHFMVLAFSSLFLLPTKWKHHPYKKKYEHKERITLLWKETEARLHHRLSKHKSITIQRSRRTRT